ncbi:MAG: response regulator [Bacteroidales bacterium]|nr:response regulator [Bacteroidales bacterium]MDD7725932.1 response regulator [Bacteroidales bacterium]MDY4175251.1 response regulator [Bacteroidales bacterium]
MEEKTGRPTVLVAEDMESNYLLVSYILRKDYNLLWAHDGEEAIEMYRTNHVDIILMDMRMPRLGGLATAEQIRKTDKETPIIALTAFAFESDREQTEKAGCNDFVPKPINAELLLSKIKKLLSA